MFNRNQNELLEEQWQRIDKFVAEFKDIPRGFGALLK
jgi:hypothetical protein